MADYAQIEVELKGVKYTTEATNSAGLLFLSILFNEEETALVKQGWMDDAVAMYSERSASRMKQKIESAKTPEEEQNIKDKLSREIIEELWQRIERNWEARSLVAERIVELFRFAKPHPIPKELVYFEVYKEGDRQHVEFGINLSAKNLLVLFNEIVGPTLADTIEKNKTDNETAVEPDVVAIAEEPTKITKGFAPVAKQEKSITLQEQQLALQKQLEAINAQLAK